ncbi:unnamed protein product [Ceratitis capitata]|uniref:(Mediterranean fruit fly) hypothetical protein n=1 Tax=Ceratitis capitata TaxID=7213 RepID=A0A811VE85_CERCA|nr:unnamed protein product [Ceratitis capitata]
MQEQQMLQRQLYQQQCHLQHQQQTHLQHNSPPPGYRSTLTVNDMPTPTITASGTTSNMAMDTLYNDSNGNLSNSCNISISGNSIGGNSCSNFFACSKPSTTSNRYNGSGSSNNNNPPFLNMKKVLNAQSCCSLQRAEVENMWNAAAAAVAVRASHATSSPCGVASQTADNTATTSSSVSTNGTNNNGHNHLSPKLLARKSLPLPLTLPAKLTTRAGARRYLPHHSTYYRRGCPLCGKFRYDVEDDSLTLSTESVLDAPTAAATLPTTTAAAGVEENVGQTYHCNGNDLNLDDGCQKLIATNGHVVCRDVFLKAEEEEDACGKVLGATVDQESDKCACEVNILESSTRAIVDDESNGNINNQNNFNVVSINNMNSESNTLLEETDDQRPRGMSDRNANTQIIVQSMATDVAEVSEEVQAVEDSTGGAAAVTANTPEDTTLDDLNANGGIIRVDMSKIIDQTGLPTYEAVEKLDTSGYV